MFQEAILIVGLSAKTMPVKWEKGITARMIKQAMRHWVDLFMMNCLCVDHRLLEDSYQIISAMDSCKRIDLNTILE